jgi:hypothetical protein
MKIKHPEILVLFIPANCISVLQPADIIIQRPLKHAFMLQFNAWTMDNITKQLNKGEEVALDFKMSTIKPLLCCWLHKAWLHVFQKQDMILKGWKQAGLSSAFDKDFQVQAMKDNMTSSLFPTSDARISTMIEQECPNEDSTLDPNDTVEEAMEQSLNKVATFYSVPTNIASVSNLQALARRAAKSKPASKQKKVRLFLKCTI